ncbi:MAG: flagellar basal-body rod protein FlgG [Candidatus Cloacimonetes bacterium]|nr:flagellar basal-body rod protein FlgG [Candidatus Cloacimonadota bacterium]
MIRSLYAATTGMLAQQMNIDNVANNMANVNTTAFKKAKVHFQDLMYQTIKEAGSPTAEGMNRPTELSVGVGVKPVSTYRSFTQGGVNNTGNPLDIAINGEGFFQLATADGEIFYGRDGSFRINELGEIVTSEGMYLEPGITLPADTESVSITQDGIVLVVLHGESTAEEIGQIELARFVNPAGLKSIGGNLYQETSASGAPSVGIPGNTTYGRVMQGYLENSNVEIVQEMEDMILAQRGYELNSKVVRTSESMLETANGLKR